MGKKKSQMPRLAPSAPGASSSYLKFDAGSGAVTLAAHAMPAVPAPRQLSLAPSGLAQKSTKGERKSARAETAGTGWDNMAAPQLTADLKRELLLIKMRGAMDPKRFYRSADDGKALPKYFQMGTIIEGAEDGRVRKTKKERKGSIMQEIMSDGVIRKRAKSQFNKSQEQNMEGRRKNIRSKPGQKKKRR